MNYYSPYFGFAPYNVAPASRGIIGGLINGIRGVNWSSFLSNTQKTLGIVNQTLPMIKQISPVMNNAKTMFKIMNEFKKVDSKPTNENIKDNKVADTKSDVTDININNEEFNNQPTFFI